MTNEEILHPQRHRIKEQAKLTYSALGRAFEKQRNAIEEQGVQVEALKSFKSFDKESPSVINRISERMLNPGIMNKLDQRTRTKN